MVTLQVPRAAALPPAAAEALMRSIAFAQQPSVAEMANALPFTVTPAPPFRLNLVISGTALALAGGPLDVDPTHTQPNLIVALQVGGGPHEPNIDPCLVGLTLLARMSHFSDARVSSQGPSVVAGRPGCEILGVYTGPDGAPRGLVQHTTVLAGGSSLRLLAYGDVARLDAVSEQVTEMAKGIVVRE